MDLYCFLQDSYILGSDHFLLILLLVITTPLFLFFIQRWNRRKGTKRLPPGPMKLPLIGNLHQLTDLPHHSLHRLSYKYGSLMFLKLGSIPTLVISSADTLGEIFKTHDLVFSGRPVMYAAKKLSYGCFDITFAPYGEYWREIRKITVLELLSAKKVQSFRTTREEEVALIIASIASSSAPIDLSETLLRLANNVICRVAFGRKYDRKDGFHAVLRETQLLAGGFHIADFFPGLRWIHKFDGLDAKIEKTFRQLDNFYEGVIEDHLDPKKPKPEVEDLVDVILRVQRDPSQGIILNRDQIKGVIMDMFIAGTDTSSATLVWAMTELIRNPTMMKRAQEELRHIVGNKQMVEESDLPQLNYLKLVVKETLRLHSPTPLLVPRETIDNCTIQGYDIPVKTRVLINAKSILTHPRIWENPEQFLPERFLNNPVDFKGQDFEYIPFGVGRRGCPAINFALVLVDLVLANLLHCFNWELPHGVEIKDVDMNEAFGITMHKKFPLCLVAKSAVV